LNGTQKDSSVISGELKGSTLPVAEFDSDFLGLGKKALQ